jgi:hypothetical protein
MLAERNKVYLVWVAGPTGIDDNETADQIAELGLLHSFIGPESDCGVSGRVVGWVIRDWVARECQ